LASPLTHFIVGASFAIPLAPRWGLVLAAGAIAVAPDLDLPVMAMLPHGGGHFFGHRGLFHAPVFLALLTTLAAWRIMRVGWVPVAIAWSLAAASHGVLDALTDRDPGVMLLFPLTDARMFFPWRPIHATPANWGMFLERAGRIFASEAPFAAAALMAGALVRQARWKLRTG
jgi:inner membrane protein